tara:strand:+ start:110 stop:688 length:579 start_codon:yes stop_codon:yes gene_type:complete
MIKKFFSEIKQFVNFIAIYFPGNSGILLRRVLYKVRLNSLGNNLFTQIGFRLSCPKNINIGDNVRLLQGSSLNSCKGKINIGNNVSINTNTDINASDGGEIEIGNDVLIGKNVYIRASDHVYLNTKKIISQSGYDSGKIKIGNNVLIGSNCVILKNVTIKDGSVIESGSVVKKDVGENEFVTSNSQINNKFQ